ncbi:MAG: hypothetical protein M0R38_02770 [Bacteroidia bacterium]|nr:hypothetical protein [Bacteroidia bacterium]
MKKFLGLLLVFSIGILQASAQCPMCKSAVVSSLQSHDEKVVGMGLNPGILIMLATVYAVIFISVTVWYLKNRKAQKRFSN